MHYIKDSQICLIYVGVLDILVRNGVWYCNIYIKTENYEHYQGISLLCVAYKLYVTVISRAGHGSRAV
jgi:hypothetical protein